MHHHSPTLLLAKLGTKWVLAGIVAFVVVNPVTWGAGLALYDHYFHSEAGARFLGHGDATPANQQGTCQLHINGHTFVVATECSRVVFPGPKRRA